MTIPSRCNRCQGALTRRSRPLLLLVGIVLCTLPLPFVRIPLAWLPALIMILAGGYLLYWASMGRGLWCRHCKAIPG
jgi:hypothetical protein